MILIDNQSIAQLIKVKRLTSKGAYSDNWFCTIWDAGNASLIYAEVPEPWSPNCWKWDADGQTWEMVALPGGYSEWVFARIDVERTTRIAAGMPYAFPDGVPGIVQLRHERDILNVNAVGTAAMMMVSAGDTDTKTDFRDQADVTHQLTAPEMLAMAQSVMAWVSGHYAAAWTHKDTIKALVEAEDYSALAGYDISQNWP